MVRQLYIILLALHPARFRYRFAFEMLAIFDEVSGQGSRLPLLADGVRSLVRQWVHPYQPAVAAVSVCAGLPLFHSLDTSLPHRRHFIMGATLSLVLFSALVTSVSRGGGQSLGIMTGAFETARRAIQAAWPATEVGVGPAPAEQLDPLFSFGVLDRDGDLMLSAREMANAPAVLRALARDKYGNLGSPVPYLVVAILDRDRDGIISTAEINHSTAVLRRLDANWDGRLVLEETREAVRVASREYRQRG